MLGTIILLLATMAGPNSVLLTRIQQIAQTSKGRVGAAATALETGESVAFNGDEHFPMQSVYKLPIAMAVLREVDDHRLGLEQKVQVEQRELVPLKAHSPLRDKYPNGVNISVRELLRYMIVESDGTACDVLLRVCGGAARVTDYLRGQGFQEIVVATMEREMAQDVSVQYQNWATPQAAVKLLGALQAGRMLSAESRALLLQLMTESTTGPHRIKGLLPVGTVVAHKTGTSGTFNGLTRATNDIGIITLPDGRHLAVAVFVSDSTADEATREGVIAQIARAAWDYWSGQTTKPATRQTKRH
jgi:beta-lactamase class A